MIPVNVGTDLSHVGLSECEGAIWLHDRSGGSRGSGQVLQEGEQTKTSGCCGHSSVQDQRISKLNPPKSRELHADRQTERCQYWMFRDRQDTRSQGLSHSQGSQWQQLKL